jgi:hypothetical protein
MLLDVTPVIYDGGRKEGNLEEGRKEGEEIRMEGSKARF